MLRYKATHYRAADQLATVRFLYDKFKETNQNHEDRFLSDYLAHVYYPGELQLLFHVAGFQVDAVWGDFHGSELSNHSRSLIVAASKLVLKNPSGRIRASFAPPTGGFLNGLGKCGMPINSCHCSRTPSGLPPRSEQKRRPS